METPSKDSDNTTADAPVVGERRSRRFWILTAVLGASLLVFVVPIALTATPRQCASCHEMKPYYDSWQTSSHRAAVSNCLTCHVRPGALNLVGFELGFYRMLFAHFAGAEVNTTKANAPSVESCRRGGCHSLNREVSNSGAIKINHRKHVVDASIACPTCHPGAVHAGVKGRLKLPPMKLCKQCHADKMTDCSYCHTEQSLSPVPGVHDATSTP